MVMNSMRIESHFSFAGFFLFNIPVSISMGERDGGSSM